MSKEDKVKEILNELGYRLADRGAYWQTNAVFRDGDNKAESLNVANATAIFLSELFRGLKV